MKKFLFVYLFVFLILFAIGCGGSDTTVNPIPIYTPTRTPVITPTSATPVPTGLPVNVTELIFSSGQTSASVKRDDIVSIYNKSTNEHAYTVEGNIPAASSMASTYESVYCRGGKKAEEFYAFVREDSKKIYRQYGPSVYKRNELTSYDQSGDQHQFWVSDADSNDVLITATLKAVGEKCYIYVDNNSSLTSNQARQVANEWDGRTYPGVVGNFGEPTNVDGDPHIFILLSPVLNEGSESRPTGLYGYFWSRDQYSPSIIPHSNYRDIIYLNSAYLVSGDSSHILEFYATLAHEFQHMVNYNYKGIYELTALDEGFSMLAEMIVGYGLPNGSVFAYQTVKSFQINPSNFSVTDWNAGGSYGTSFLFMCYNYDRFGVEAIKKMVSGSSNTGIENIENVTGMSFSTIYKDWVIANLLDGTSSDPRFHYSSIDMYGNFSDRYYNKQSLPGIQTQSLSGGNKNLKPWCVNYMKSSGTGSFTINGLSLGGLLFN